LRVSLQCCILDLDTGLPVQVRDAALGVATDPIPQSDVGKEYAVAQISQQARLRRSKCCLARLGGVLTLTHHPTSSLRR
jgi:hypothetical protein